MEVHTFINVYLYRYGRVIGNRASKGSVKLLKNRTDVIFTELPALVSVPYNCMLVLTPDKPQAAACQRKLCRRQL